MNLKIATTLIVLIACTFAAIAQNNQLSDKEKNEGWALLFNGKDFEGWRGVNKTHFPEKGWEVRNEAIVCTQEKGGSIITTNKYENFELKWQWKVVEEMANSGLKYFVNERKRDSGGYGYGIEYQMHDNGLCDKNSLGSAYDLYEASPNRKAKKPGGWNDSKVVSKNGKIEHWLNGIKILEYDRFSKDFKRKRRNSKFRGVRKFGVHKNGHLLLQDHDSEVHIKNLKLKEL